MASSGVTTMLGQHGDDVIDQAHGLCWQTGGRGGQVRFMWKNWTSRYNRFICVSNDAAETYEQPCRKTPND
jgi:hypothetical protein